MSPPAGTAAGYRRRCAAAALAASLLGWSPAAAADPGRALPDLAPPSLVPSGPQQATLDVMAGVEVSFASRSPFTLADLGGGADREPPTTARATLFLPADASAAAPVPAVIMLHGASGVLEEREMTYGRQFAAMGVAALVIDVFAARRDRATGFVDRLLNITEAMFLADAYAGLGYLAARPEVDGDRVVLIGFSYGGMVATYAAYAQVAEAFAADGVRFAGHVAYYAPCIAEFEDGRATGAPLLMLYGGKDAIVDPARCAEVAEGLEAGGSPVETVIYPDAVHQWDGRFGAPRMIGRNLAPCRFHVARDGQVYDSFWPLRMDGPFARKLILGLCAASEGYLIGRDDAVRERSNADLARFLERVFSARR